MPQNSLIYHIDLLSGAATALLCVCMIVLAAGCSSTNQPPAQGDSALGEVPPRVQQWMDSLTVAHRYDPQTGFIVAREVIALPPVLRDGPTLPEAVERGMKLNRPVIAFATADRCAPCQQFKKDALNDSAVLQRLHQDDVIATHIEVDRSPEEAERYLGGMAIPMTYLIVDGAAVDSLAGQRSAEDLLSWIQKVIPDTGSDSDVSND